MKNFWDISLSRRPKDGDQIESQVFVPSPRLTLLILLLLSAVRNDMLLISFITTKFCSSRLKFYQVQIKKCLKKKKKK